MAVYTPIDEDVAARLLRGMGLAALVRLEPIAAGIENTNYRLVTEGGDYVLTVFEREGPARVRQTLDAVSELCRDGVACRGPVMGPQGPLFEIAGKPATLTPFVCGISVADPTHVHLRALGRALARIHREGEGVGGHLEDGPHLGRVLCPMARRIADAVEAGHPELAKLLRHEADAQEAVQEEGLPGGLVHADPFLDNVIFDPDTSEVLAILDFYQAGRGPWLFDIAVVIADAAWRDDRVDGDRVRAFLGGYRQERPLGVEELACLPAYLRRVALRFLCLRIERFLLSDPAMRVGKPKSPEEYARKLRFFQGQPC